LANTRNGDGPVLVALLGECILDVAVPATLPGHCKTLISTHTKREALLLGNELAQAAKRAGDDYLEVIDKIRDTGLTTVAGRGLPQIISATKLCASPPATPPELIEGILHRGGKLALGGGNKSFKTWTLLELAICVSMGWEWLGFPTTAAKVLYLNFELPEFAMAQRVREICEARKVTFPADLNFWNLRGYAADAAAILPKIARQAKREEYSLIILDPLYKLLGARDENASRDMANLMNEIERVAVETGAAVAFGSHYSKGNQAGKESMDRISGSGVFARDPDTIITMTRHEQDDAFSIEMTLRNFPPQEPFVVRREHPLMVIDGQLDPAKLKKPLGREPEHTAGDILKIYTANMKTTADWQRTCEEEGVSRRTFCRLKKQLEAQGKVSKSAVDGSLIVHK
jgi:AAA domain